MSKDRVTENYTTKKGVLTGFISVFKPSTKFNAKGVYSASIILDKEEGEFLVQYAKDVAKLQFKKFGNGKKISALTCIKPYTTVNEDGEEITDEKGRYILKTSAKAWIENGIPTNKILVVDSKKTPLKNLNIGEGTQARLFVTFEGYTTPKETNVTAVLKAVQIIDLVERAGTTLEQTGFEEEAGYTFEGEEDITEEDIVQDDEEEDY